MRTIISVNDFLLTGEFGGLREDSTPSDVIEMFGEPTDDLDQRDGIRYLVYSGYEIGFFEGAPMYVQNDNLQWQLSLRHFQNEKICIDPWIFAHREPYTKPEIVRILSGMNASFRHVIYCQRKDLQLESGVILDFNPTCRNPDRIVCTALSLSFPDFDYAGRCVEVIEEECPEAPTDEET